MTPPTATSTLHAVECLTLLATLIGSLELLHQRHLFSPGQLYATPPTRTLSAPTAWIVRRLTLLFRAPAILYLIALQATLAAILLCQIAQSAPLTAYHLALTTYHSRGPSPALLFLVTVLAFLLHIRDHDAGTGADRFLLQLLPACTLAELIGTSNARTLVLFFIAAQAALAYGTSGFLKLRHAPWRNGAALLHILSSAQEGNRRLYLFLRTRPRLATLGGLAVCAESLLALAAFTPPTLCLILLAAGLLMHLAIARLMGLNTYLLAFPAAYPAIYFVSRVLYNHLQIFSK